MLEQKFPIVLWRPPIHTSPENREELEDPNLQEATRRILLPGENDPREGEIVASYDGLQGGQLFSPAEIAGLTQAAEEKFAFLKPDSSSEVTPGT